MEKIEDLIREELGQEAGLPQVTPLLLELDKHRVMAADELQEEEFLFRMNGVPCFPRRELSAITGQAKSGKTFFTSMLLACGLRKQVLAMERIGEEPLRVMWFDTEQSCRSTQRILKNRVMTLAETTDDSPFFVFNVRGEDCEQRMELLTEGIVTYRPDLVILDGIRDLVHDINDGVKATEIIGRLLKLAEEFDCCIACVLHQNRSADNRGLRGWLGTELMNKVFEMYSCEKLRPDREGVVKFCVEQTLTRKYDMEQPLCYAVGDDGLPVVAEIPARQPRDEQGKFMSKSNALESLNRTYIIGNDGENWHWDVRRLFADAMGNRATWGYDDLMTGVMDLSRIKCKQHYYKLFAEAETQRVVMKTLDRCGRVVVMMLPDGGGRSG